MGRLMKSKKEMKFKNQEALMYAKNVIDEADEMLKDFSRKMIDCPFSEALMGALGISAGTGISISYLYFGGTVTGLSAPGITSGLAAAGRIIGRGMVGGIVVMTIPIILLGGVGFGLTHWIKSKRFKDAKDLLYKDAIAKQTAIIEQLQNDQEGDKERIESLTCMNRLLSTIIHDLEYDLEIEDDNDE